MILEVSYSYNAKAVHSCTGHWDCNLDWHEGAMWPQDAILIDLLNQVNRSPQHTIQQETIPSNITSAEINDGP